MTLLCIVNGTWKYIILGSNVHINLFSHETWTFKRWYWITGVAAPPVSATAISLRQGLQSEFCIVVCMLCSAKPSWLLGTPQGHYSVERTVSSCLGATAVWHTGYLEFSLREVLLWERERKRKCCCLVLYLHYFIKMRESGKNIYLASNMFGSHGFNVMKIVWSRVPEADL